MEIQRVGIVGCGIMGSGIALLCAQKGFDVCIMEQNEAFLKKGLASIERQLPKDADKAQILDRISGRCDFESFGKCDLVIEAVTENLALKKQIFATLDNICPGHAILASNTSVLPVIEMASATGRPHKVMGTHFLTPPQVIPLLEIVQTLATGMEELETMRRFGEAIGKKVAVSKDRPGFIVNRILTPILLNAVRLHEEGTGSMADIETAVKDGLGLPMGPFKLLDLIGLDTIQKGTTAMYNELNDPQYACPVTISRMVSAGWLGRKSGKGFYEYRKK